MIETYAGFSSLHCQFSMYLWRHANHKFPAEIFACYWFGNWLIVIAYV